MEFRRLLHWGPITALTIIIILFCTSILTVIAWIPPDDLFGVINLIIFLFWVFNILKNFFKASFLGPGHLPYKWKPDLDEDQDYLQFCESCQGYKAPRAHHCKTCKRCIKKMDHHCPWINNCVGHCNHKSFTLFLIFVVIGCSHGAVMMILCVLDHIKWKHGGILFKVKPNSLILMSPYLLIILFFGIGLAIGVALAVGILLYYQVKSIIRNETGIEAWIVEKAMSRNRYDGEEFIYPYDLGGLSENVSQVMTWSHDYVGDGITWPVFEGCDQYTLTIEQLEQKDIKRDRTIIYKVIKPFSGTWFPLSFGIRVCFDTPWSEETRTPVVVGDIIYATRIRKRWVYGEKEQKSSEINKKSIKLGESHRLKGWVPRCCVEELIEDGVTVLGKEKTS